MSKLADNLTSVQQRIRATAAKCSVPAPRLLAVSKTHSAGEVRAAFALGLTDFGENYVQEALDKQALLKDLAIKWHFIGPIQSNKTRAIAENFDWVHSVDRLKVARRLSEQRDRLEPLNICIQVNIDQAPTKAGVLPGEAQALMEACAALPNLKLRGLMAIPDPTSAEPPGESPFMQLANLQADICRAHPELALDTLSMGMSGDLEEAIAGGSTLVRIGTDIFGPRPSTP